MKFLGWEAPHPPKCQGKMADAHGTLVPLLTTAARCSCGIHSLATTDITIAEHEVWCSPRLTWRLYHRARVSQITNSCSAATADILPVVLPETWL